MQLVSPQFMNALSYSQTPLDKVTVWRGGFPVKGAEDLTVESGSVTISGGNGQIVKAVAEITVIDSNGKLVPNRVEDALAPFGSELQIQMGLKIGVKPEMVNMGFFPILSTEIDEQWRIVSRPDEPGIDYWVSKGARLAVEAADRTVNIDTNKFINREQPSYSTALVEAKRLLIDNQPPFGGVIGSVPDKAIPVTVTYESDRLKALLDLGEVLDADSVIDEWGSFKYQSRAESAPVWRLEVGEFSVLKKTKRKITRDGVYNGAIEKGSGPTDAPLQAQKLIMDGALAWGGPYGKVPLQHASSLLDTQAKVDAGVISVLARATQVTPQNVPIECIRNPALRWGDRIELPTRTGYITVQVTSLKFGFGVESMTLVVSADPFLLGGLL